MIMAHVSFDVLLSIGEECGGGYYGNTGGFLWTIVDGRI